MWALDQVPINLSGYILGLGLALEHAAKTKRLPFRSLDSQLTSSERNMLLPNCLGNSASATYPAKYRSVPGGTPRNE